MDPAASSSRLGSIRGGSSRRGRGRGRGQLRKSKFVPTIAPRKKQEATSSASERSVASTLPKIMQEVKKVQLKKERPRHKLNDPLANAKVAFVASSARKSFTPIERSAAQLGSFMSAPQSPNQDDDDSDAEMTNGANAAPYPPIVWPQACPPDSASEALDEKPPPKTEQKFVDDSPAALFSSSMSTESDAAEAKPSFMFWQLPCALPVSPASLQRLDKQKAADAKNANSVSSKAEVSAVKPMSKASSFTPSAPPVAQMFAETKGSLSSLPSGYIGKLVVYKSGRVALKCGDIVLDVSSASPYPFEQEVVSIDKESKEFCRLGSINQRLVCSLNIESLLSSATL